MINKILEKLIFDDVKPNHLLDTEYLQSYIRNDSNFAPLPLALGETWERVPDELIRHLRNTEPYESGYQISMYGLPSFRKCLKNYIFNTERISHNFKEEIEVGVTWNGTRSSMVDFGRYMLDKQKNKDLQPIFLTTDPSWDYEGVFVPLGFKQKKILLNPENNFIPSKEDFREILDETNQNENESISFIVINAQHNPTGENWSTNLVEDIIKLAAHYQCGLLIDNAYYGSTSDKNQLKTSVLSLLEKHWELIEENNITNLIFGVRSLGKQFHCNGWGIGAIWATPRTLDEIVNKYRTIHSYNYNGIFQKAMEKWLKSNESQLFLEDLHLEKKRKDAYLKTTFIEELKYPIKSIHVGDYCPYMIFEIPLKYQKENDSVKFFIKDLFYKTGVLLTDCWAIPRNESKQGHLKYVRMYTGVREDVIQDALNRMIIQGFTYE
ncbi:hypothetical protein ASG61_20795 [Bacillus sp. Leaf75]|nr:hypothetical protein ASG61_20795 [Bacillus sp. Leaf75]